MLQVRAPSTRQLALAGPRSVFSRSSRSSRRSSRRSNDDPTNDNDETIMVQRKNTQETQKTNSSYSQHSPNSHPSSSILLMGGHRVHPFELPQNQRLVPRADVYIYLFLSSCAATASLSLTTMSNGRRGGEKVALGLCGLSCVLSAFVGVGFRYRPFRKWFTGSSSSASSASAGYPNAKSLDGDQPHKQQQQNGDRAITRTSSCCASPPENQCSLLQLLLWVISSIYILNPNNYLGSSPAGNIWNTNLFFATYVSFGLCCYLFAELVVRGPLYSGSSVSIGNNNNNSNKNQGNLANGINSKLGVVSWNHHTNVHQKIGIGFILLGIASVSLLAFSLDQKMSSLCSPSAFSSSSSLLYIDQSSFCNRTIMGIIFGVLGLLASLAHCVIGILSNAQLKRFQNRGYPPQDLQNIHNANLKRRNLLGTVLSTSCLLFYSINAGFATSDGGPGGNPSNIYFVSWICFGLSLFLCVKHLEAYSVPEASRVPSSSQETVMDVEYYGGKIIGGGSNHGSHHGSGSGGRVHKVVPRANSRGSVETASRFSRDELEGGQHPEQILDGDEDDDDNSESPILYLPNDFHDDSSSLGDTYFGNTFYQQQQDGGEQYQGETGHDQGPAGQFHQQQYCGNVGVGRDPSFHVDNMPQAPPQDPSQGSQHYGQPSPPPQEPQKQTRFDEPDDLPFMYEIDEDDMPIPTPHFDRRKTRLSLFNSFGKKNNDASAAAAAAAASMGMDPVREVESSSSEPPSTVTGGVPSIEKRREPESESSSNSGPRRHSQNAMDGDGFKLRHTTSRRYDDDFMNEIVEEEDWMMGTMYGLGGNSRAKRSTTSSRSSSRQQPVASVGNSRTKRSTTSSRSSSRQHPPPPPLPQQHSGAASTFSRSKSSGSSSRDPTPSKAASRSSSRGKQRSKSESRAERSSSRSSANKNSKRGNRRATVDSNMSGGPPTLSADEESYSNQHRSSSYREEGPPTVSASGSFDDDEGIESVTPRYLDPRPVRDVPAQQYDSMSILSDPTMDGYYEENNGPQDPVLSAMSSRRNSKKQQENQSTHSSDTDNHQDEQGMVDKMVLEALKQAHVARSNSLHSKGGNSGRSGSQRRGGGRASGSKQHYQQQQQQYEKHSSQSPPQSRVRTSKRSGSGGPKSIHSFYSHGDSSSGTALTSEGDKAFAC